MKRLGARLDGLARCQVLFIFKRRLHCNGGMRTDMIIDMDPVNHGGDSCFVAGKPFPANEHLAL